MIVYESRIIKGQRTYVTYVIVQFNGMFPRHIVKKEGYINNETTLSRV